MRCSDLFMRMGSFVSKAAALGLASLLVSASGADSAEIKVMISGGLTAAYRALTPEFERATGNKVVTAFGPSMGNTPEAIPVRIARGEPVDVLIMVGYALGGLIEQGKVVAGSRVDLVRSPIGMAVRAGAPKPDISSVDAFKRALLQAKSVAYSDSASGEIGFQQISELLPVPGIDLVGPLPPEIQKITVFSAGVAVGAKEPDAGRALIKFLASPAAAPTMAKSGLETITSAE